MIERSLLSIERHCMIVWGTSPFDHGLCFLQYTCHDDHNIVTTMTTNLVLSFTYPIVIHFQATITRAHGY